LVEARYTIHLEPDASGRVLRFWLDHSRPHDIEDVWGFFRVEQFDGRRSLLTVAVALDIGTGLMSTLFEGKIVGLVLATPGYIRDFVEPRRLAASQ
jgi:hypothetical protein